MLKSLKYMLKIQKENVVKVNFGQGGDTAKRWNNEN